MNRSSTQPERAWQMALNRLKMDMPKSAFNSWVRDTSFVSFEDGVFSVGTPNAYGREWLASRMTSTVARLLTGILGQQVEVQFIVIELPGEEDDLFETENPVIDQHPTVLSLQAKYQSVYDEIVRPDQVIVVPGYFLRYISLLGVELAWLYIGFRQAAYEAGASRQPGKKFAAPAKKIAGHSGMSLRTFRRWSAKPDTWKRLQGLVAPVEDKPQWQHGEDGHPHRIPSYYRVSMTFPLTPPDEIFLRTWLYRHLSEGKSPLTVIRAAIDTPTTELIPWQNNTPPQGDTGIELHSVQDILHTVCGPISESDCPEFQKLADELARHLMPPKDLVFLTHYFVTNWLPKLGPGQGWFVVMLRDRCYINQRTGELRDVAQVDQGYAEVARWLSLKRTKTVWEWLRNDDIARFIREIKNEIGFWDEAQRSFQVCMGEPLTEKDQIRADELVARRYIGTSDTYRKKQDKDPIGASVTHNGATFPMLANHPALLAPLANTPRAAQEVVERALGECDHRAALYMKMDGYPESLEEFNRISVHHDGEPLHRLLVVLDEFSALVTALGGPKGSFANQVAELGWRGRKFGIHLVFAAQDFTKQVVGRVRDQVSAVVCFRVRSPEAARAVGCPEAVRIPESRPGLACTDRWGLVQTFYLDKRLLAQIGPQSALNPQELQLAQRALDEADGKMSLPLLVSWGIAERRARSLVEGWEQRGWLRQDSVRQNARYITPKLMSILSSGQSRQTTSNLSNH